MSTELLNSIVNNYVMTVDFVLIVSVTLTIFTQFVYTKHLCFCQSYYGVY